MAQQSDTEPRPAPKTQGRATHDLQQRIINKQENTKGTDAPLPGETLKHAAMRYPKPGPGDENAMQTGNRSIQRGANDESEHRKRRSRQA
ncbi:MAG: hypothetical protein ACTHKD_16345 [Devosia sp.]|jgi:hypothetical protein